MRGVRAALAALAAMASGALLAEDRRPSTSPAADGAEGAAGERAWPLPVTSFGIGGGGALFQPAISPHDPRLVFVQCDMGGVYRTEDGGETWRVIDGHELRAAVCDDCPPMAFTFAPDDPAVVYAYGEQRGREGLFVSRDRGATFARMPGDFPGAGEIVSMLAIDAARPAEMLAGTTDGAYISRDRGRTWKSARSALPAEVKNVVGGHITGDAWLVVAEGGVALSGDRGASWQLEGKGLPVSPIRRVSGGPRVFYVTVASHARAGGFDGGVYRSDDGGRRWQSAMGAGINKSISPASADARDPIAQYTFLGVAAGAPQSVYVTTRGNGTLPPHDFNVWKTDDAGARWREVLMGDLGLPARNVTAGWLTADYGFWWGADAYGFTTSPTDPRRAIYTNLGELFETRDGGATWAQRYTRREPDGAPTPRARWRSRGIDVTSSWHHYVDPFAPHVRYLAHSDIGLTRSEDGGHTWRHAVAGSPWTNSVYELAFDPTWRGRLWGAAARQHDIPHWTQLEGPRAGGGVIFSDDGGDTWVARSRGLPDAPATSIAIDAHAERGAARRLWVAMFGYGIYRTDDGGHSWQAASTGLGSGENRNVFHVQRHPSGALFASVTGKRIGKKLAPNGGIFRSDDRGESWRAVTPAGAPFTAWVQGFAVDPADARVLYVAAADAPLIALDPKDDQPTGGLYATDDGGASWRKLPLPRAPGVPLEVFAPSLHPRDARVVFATTNGHGTWVSHDAGTSWRELREMPFLSTHRVEVDPADPRVLYVSTFGGGAFRVVDPAFSSLSR